MEVCLRFDNFAALLKGRLAAENGRNKQCIMAKGRGSSNDEQEWKSYSRVMKGLQSKPFVSSTGETRSVGRPAGSATQMQSSPIRREKSDGEWKLWLTSDRSERVKHQQASFQEQCKQDYERLKKKN